MLGAFTTSLHEQREVMRLKWARLTCMWRGGKKPETVHVLQSVAKMSLSTSELIEKGRFFMKSLPQNLIYLWTGIPNFHEKLQRKCSFQNILTSSNKLYGNFKKVAIKILSLVFALPSVLFSFLTLPCSLFDLSQVHLDPECLQFWAAFGLSFLNTGAFSYVHEVEGFVINLKRHVLSCVIVLARISFLIHMWLL